MRPTVNIEQCRNGYILRWRDPGEEIMIFDTLKSLSHYLVEHFDALSEYDQAEYKP